jgi:hypothetical protein
MKGKRFRFPLDLISTLRFGQYDVKRQGFPLVVHRFVDSTQSDMDCPRAGTRPECVSQGDNFQGLLRVTTDESSLLDEQADPIIWSGFLPVLPSQISLIGIPGENGSHLRGEMIARIVDHRETAVPERWRVERQRDDFASLAHDSRASRRTGFPDESDDDKRRVKCVTLEPMGVAASVVIIKFEGIRFWFDADGTAPEYLVSIPPSRSPSGSPGHESTMPPPEGSAPPAAGTERDSSGASRPPDN